MLIRSSSLIVLFKSSVGLLFFVFFLFWYIPSLTERAARSSAVIVDLSLSLFSSVSLLVF